MSQLDRYLAYAHAHPEQFTNPPDTLLTILLDPEHIAAVESQMRERLVAAGATAEQAAEWARVGIAYQDQYIFLLRDAVRFANGSLGTYIRFVDPGDSAPGVIILPLFQRQVVLVRHFRHAARQWRLELPRGFGESGYSTEENAARELREEVQGEIARLIPLGMVEPDTGMSAEADALFFAELASVGQPDIVEGISDIQLTPIAEFERLISDGTITDGFTLAAYARAKARGLL